MKESWAIFNNSQFRRKIAMPMLQDEIDKIQQLNGKLDNEIRRTIFKRGMLKATIMIGDHFKSMSPQAALDAINLVSDNIDRIALEAFPD